MSAAAKRRGGLRHTLFSFEGRLGRQTWWLWSLAFSGSHMLLRLVVEAVFGNPKSRGDYGTGQLAQLLLTLLIVWPVLVVNVKRLHDRNLSGGWLTPAYLPLALMMVITLVKGGYIPGYGLIVFQHEGLGAYNTVKAIQVVASLGLAVVVGFLPGNPGKNRFGPPPGHRSDSEVADVFA